MRTSLRGVFGSFLWCAPSSTGRARWPRRFFQRSCASLLQCGLSRHASHAVEKCCRRGHSGSFRHFVLAMPSPDALCSRSTTHRASQTKAACSHVQDVLVTTIFSEALLEQKFDNNCRHAVHLFTPRLRESKGESDMSTCSLGPCAYQREGSRA